MDHDPKFLSVDFPSILVSKAVTHIEVVTFLRHVMPTPIWKLLRWLGVGEKDYKKACETLDNFIYSCIARKREEMRTEISEVSTDLLSLYMDDVENAKTLINNNNGDKFLKDTILNSFIAGGDTTSVAFSWFFYLLSINPQVIVKIREELKTIIIQNHDTHADIFSRNFIENSSKLVYLHAALCEDLRLYPPVAFNHKTSVNSDILPSGHRVDPNTQIIFNMYAMGRMKRIWGDDCDEFKPERWISERGIIKLEPTYKFLAFGAGQRFCQGKDMVFTQMKAVVAAIIQKYDIEAVKGHQVVPDISFVLQMKHGFKVKLSHSQY